MTPRCEDSSGRFQIGDIYVVDVEDGETGEFTGFLGDHIACPIVPSDDVIAQWDVNSGNNYEKVDEYPNTDGDGSRVSNVTSGRTDRYDTITTIDDGTSGTDEVTAVNFYIKHKLAFAGASRDVRLVVWNADGNYANTDDVSTGQTFYKGDKRVFNNRILDTGDSIKWTVQDFTTKDFDMGLLSNN